MSKIKLKKFEVCATCYSVGMTDINCVCVYEHKWDTIELEFEVCSCCGSLIEDGNPADTEFNKKQLD